MPLRVHFKVGLYVFFFSLFPVQMNLLKKVTTTGIFDDFPPTQSSNDVTALTILRENYIPKSDQHSRTLELVANSKMNYTIVPRCMLASIP